MPQTFEELKPILRPTGVHFGKMRVDPDTCTSCGQCIENCVFKCWEMDENQIPKMKASHSCFSCFNCMVACPVDAVSIVDSYHVDEGFFDTGFPRVVMPVEPKDGKGNPSQWNEVERLILDRRSVRNYTDEPVPDHIIRRILEAGRFAPSGGNQQPWRFVVVTDKAFIEELEQAAQAAISGMHTMYEDDAQVMALATSLGDPVPPALFDPRIQGGSGCVERKELPVFLNAPAVIFMTGNDKLYGADLHVGICGQNMNLAAQSLGVGFCWGGFGAFVENLPEIKEKLGVRPPWRIIQSAMLGYPKFKQRGMVPRMKRPVTWFRAGAGGPVVEE
jgi:nitroreductase/NAD-dependent dihydropyrimidine dehydrogenase PreA subunit